MSDARPARQGAPFHKPLASVHHCSLTVLHRQLSIFFSVYGSVSGGLIGSGHDFALCSPRATLTKRS